MITASYAASLAGGALFVAIYSAYRLDLLEKKVEQLEKQLKGEPAVKNTTVCEASGKSSETASNSFRALLLCIGTIALITLILHLAGLLGQ